MFKPVPNQIDFVAQEHEILEYWRSSDAFAKLRTLRSESPRWSFIDGPITANNPMGVHHGWGRTYKDLFHRWKAMQGFRTRYQNGFDCQGLWVEVNVERDMGFNTKRDIEAYGLAEFVILCKQRVLEYSAVQTDQSIRLGYWMDWDDPAFLRRLGKLLGEDPMRQITVDGPEGPVSNTVEWIVGRLGMREMGGSYFTFSDENNYTIWRMLKSCHDRGWIYKGRDVMPWCGRCGTGLSQHEIVTEGYRELTHPSITLRFPLKERPGESLLVWTTTPWTLSSNVAAAVGADLDYVRVRQGEELFYLSKQTLHMLKGEYTVEDELKGSAMEGWEYTGPFDELPAQIEGKGPESHRVIIWDEVGEEEGTGIVHIAPGCGAEDFALSKEFNLPAIAPLNESGVFVEGYDWLTGMAAGETASMIFENLKEKGLAYNIEDYTHRYPVCWRCREELVFRLVDEWFISMGEKLNKPYDEITPEEKEHNLRYQIMEVVVDGTRWYPAFGFERELDWLRNMDDWMISKKRYWGLALPIFECESCGGFDVIGGREELEERAVEGWEQFDGHSPHRPHVDAVQISCSKCGDKVRRIPDVGDPWLDAGIVGMSTLRYKDDVDFWSEWFPADLISESFPGQFRNWFYSLLAMSTILERKAPFKDVFTYGTLLAEDGREMHKSWGNSIEFNEAADKMGVDVMRWMYCDHKPEKDLMFGYQKADEVRRQFLIPLWNVYSFFATYARIDGWMPDSKRKAAYSVLDRWILSRLQELVQEVSNRLEKYEPNQATAVVGKFVDDLSNWYLRRCRRRFWAKSGTSKASDDDKHAAYSTLHQTLVTLTKLLAPFVPFVTEAMYQNLVRTLDQDAPESVHHCDWPNHDPKILDDQLNAQMGLVLRLVSLGHAARNQSNLKVRQPLAEASFAVGAAEDREVVNAFEDLIKDELNVKRIRLLDEASEVVAYQLHPLPRQLGQKYGARFPILKKAIMELDAAEAAKTLLTGKSIEVDFEGDKLDILPEEVEVRFEALEGIAAAAEGGYVVGLDTALTDDLIAEGLMREFVRRVQAMRKDAGLDVDDRIHLAYKASERLTRAIETHREFVMAEVLATEMQEVKKPKGKHTAEHAFDGETLAAALDPIEAAS
jgi:isoleucyl-tRNA synthetase